MYVYHTHTSMSIFMGNIYKYTCIHTYLKNSNIRTLIKDRFYKKSATRLRPALWVLRQETHSHISGQLE